VNDKGCIEHVEVIVIGRIKTSQAGSVQNRPR
jgi:hypothetical protein